MKFRTVVLDCDSTLSRIEGIDELSSLRDESIRSLVKRSTRLAMEGNTPLEEVYGQRLSWIQPTEAEVEAIGRRYAECVVPDARAVIADLQALGKDVVVVSGGLFPAVRSFAATLGIAATQVHAVPIHFDAEGNYSGFDASHPLCRSGGKPELLVSFGPERRPICLVGDGVSDLEATDAVERFVGFGGVVVRSAVERGAERYVREPSLRAVLRHCLDESELARLEAP